MSVLLLLCVGAIIVVVGCLSLACIEGPPLSGELLAVAMIKGIRRCHRLIYILVVRHVELRAMNFVVVHNGRLPLRYDLSLTFVVFRGHNILQVYI